MNKKVPRLGEILIQKGWITWEQLEEALRIQNAPSPLDYVSSSIKPTLSRETPLSIGEILIRNQWISREQLNEALDHQHHTGEILGDILIKKKFVTEMHLQKALAIQHGLSFVELKKINIPQKVISLVPKHLAHEYHFVPLVHNNNTLLIAICNPKDVNAVLATSKLLPHFQILTALMTESDLKEALQQYYAII